ncbi:MAG TPA: hypothetical protein VKR06_23210 [Ktedonosporobacter sp.]|nr:hypothetical protein [Ktedonosporobacter sp.]
MPVTKKKRTTSTLNPSTPESSSPVLPPQEGFHQHLHALARGAVRIVIETAMREELDQFISIAFPASSLFSSRYRFRLCLREWVAIRRVAPGSCREMQGPYTVHGFRPETGQFQTTVYNTKQVFSAS